MAISSKVIKLISNFNLFNYYHRHNYHRHHHHHQHDHYYHHYQARQHYYGARYNILAIYSILICLYCYCCLLIQFTICDKYDLNTLNNDNNNGSLSMFVNEDFSTTTITTTTTSIKEALKLSAAKDVENVSKINESSVTNTSTLKIISLNLPAKLDNNKNNNLKHRKHRHQLHRKFLEKHPTNNRIHYPDYNKALNKKRKSSWKLSRSSRQRNFFRSLHFDERLLFNDDSENNEDISSSFHNGAPFDNVSTMDRTNIQRQYNHHRHTNHNHNNQVPLKRKPNIIFILTDDQDIELGSMNYMPKTMKIMSEEGIQMKNAYSTTP